MLGKCTWCGKIEKISLPPNSHCIDYKKCDLNRIANKNKIDLVDEKNKKYILVKTIHNTIYYLRIRYRIPKGAIFGKGFGPKKLYEFVVEKNFCTKFSFDEILINYNLFGGKIIYD